MVQQQVHTFLEADMNGVSEVRGTLFGPCYKEILLLGGLFYWSPILVNPQICRVTRAGVKPQTLIPRPYKS